MAAPSYASQLAQIRKQSQQQAAESLQGQIDATKAAYDSQLARTQARQDAAANLLKDFGVTTSRYLTNAAKSAGRGFDTQAAAQALLGAVGQRAFSGSSVPNVAANLAAAGNGALGQALASQDANRNAVLGGVINRIVGTDPARQFSRQSVQAVQQALGNATANTGYNARLLAGLLNQQKDAYNTLLDKKTSYVASVPNMIASAASKLTDQELTSLYRQMNLDESKAYHDATLKISQQNADANTQRAAKYKTGTSGGGGGGSSSGAGSILAPVKSVTAAMNAAGYPGLWGGTAKKPVAITKNGKQLSVPAGFLSKASSDGSTAKDAVNKAALTAAQSVRGDATIPSDLSREDAVTKVAANLMFLHSSWSPAKIHAAAVAAVNQLDGWTTPAPAAAVQQAPAKTYKLGKSGIFVYNDPREATGNNTPGVHWTKKIAPGDPGFADALAKAIDPATMKPLTRAQIDAVLAATK